MALPVSCLKASARLNDHGGQVWDRKGRLGDWLDFSANIWPEIPDSISRVNMRELLPHYPDPECRALTAAAAGFYHVAPEQVLAANGATEALYITMQALRPRSVAVFHPTFSEYEAAARWSVPGVRTLCGPVDFANGFRPVLDVPDAEMAILANPNNPTGTLLSPEEVLTWANRCRDAGVWVVIDEAFMEFVSGDSASLVSELSHKPNLLVLRSVTKRFGLAGIRLGFVLGSSQVISILRGARIPWSVNVIAQCLGARVLAQRDDGTFAQRVGELRAQLTADLRDLGWIVWPSPANFLLCRLPAGCSNRELLACLRDRGILLRDASTFRSLDDSFVRCAVRTAKDNQRLVRAINECEWRRK